MRIGLGSDKQALWTGQEMISSLNLIWYGITVLFVLGCITIYLAVRTIRDVKAFRSTQNQLLIKVVIAGLADMEDKISLLLRDRGYTNEQINEWLESQRKFSRQNFQSQDQNG
jgi:hypothetical protein